MQRTAIIGAAGTGKTHLLIESVARLLEGERLESSGDKILILTSSPRAASNISLRLKGARPDHHADDVGKMPAPTVVIHTVRSLCEAVLKYDNPELQILSDFRGWFILRECIRAGTIPMRSSYTRVKGKRSFIREMLELIEAATVNSIPIDQLPGADQAADKLEDIKNIYKYYKDFCQRHNLVPSFDVIPRASDMLSEYGEQFSHVFIDQYEDLCPGEVQAIQLLSSDHANITVFMDAVRCDPNRSAAILPASFSISGLHHGKELENTEDHGRLSTGITRHVNRLLGKMVYPETTQTCGQDARAPGGNDQILTIAAQEAAMDEAEYIARTIRKESRRPGRKYTDFAVLCRDMESLGSAIRDALEKYSIPCSGGLDVSQDPMVRFIILCLQVVDEPHNDDAVLKWLSSPIARLHRADVYRAYARARKEKQELLKIAAEEPSSNKLAACSTGARLKELLSILDFIKAERQSGSDIWQLVDPILVKSLSENRRLSKAKPVSKPGFRIGSKSGAIDAGEMSVPPEVEHAASLFLSEKMPRAVTIFTQVIRDIEATYGEKRKLSVMLADIRAGLRQISDPDVLICEDGDAVRIMSIRESRGLEFPFVFIPGMVSDFFPARHPARQLLYGEDLGLTRDALRDIDLPGTISPDKWREQERHLFYIAMTRTRERLYLTFAHQYPENEDCEPSPFLGDLLDGKEISADNCAHYNIIYQDRTVSSLPGGLPALDDVDSRSDLEIACYRYVRELERLDRQKAAEAAELLSSMGVVGDLIPPVPLKEVAIQSPSRDFNHTSIRTFLSCPRRYFLAHLLRVESEYQPGARFGQLVHEVLGEFHSRYRKLCDYDLEELWLDMRRMLFNVWESKYEVEFVHNRLQAQSYRRLVEEVLGAYLQAEHSRWDGDRFCILTEKFFDFSFFDKYRLKGRIDRIDSCASTGDETIDFKTSAYDKEAESALKSKFINMDNDPDYQPQDYQLPIYYLAGLDNPDVDPKRLVLYQLRNFSKSTGAPFRRELEILPDENTRSGKKDKFLTGADLESVKGDILRTLDKMVSGFYPPEPRDDNVCERECDFSFLCDREESDSQ